VAAACAAIGGVAALSQIGGRAEASDHDDGETDLKSRALNLTDHFAFKSPADPTVLSLIMYFNPRSLPGRQYFLSENARYEFHVSKIAAVTDAPTLKDDFVFRFEASAPTPAGNQFITMTVLQDGAVIGSHIGTSATIANSRAGGAGLTTNTTSIAGTANVRYFVGMRADSFHFDVNRFFQVRSYLAARFFGGTGGNGDAGAQLAKNCRGDDFLAVLGGGLSENGAPDSDTINLFNPASCAPDFTKNLNVTAIVLNVPIALLGGTPTSIYDTWSSISVAR
jgi:hypothetical protein